MTRHLFAALQGDIRRLAAAKLLLAIAGLCSIGSPVFAAQASAQFDVMITLRPARQDQTGECASTGVVNGTTPPMIVCGPRPPGDRFVALASTLKWPYADRGYRFISYITGSAGSVDIFTAAGTSTAFRLVNWADREYIEMTVGW